MGFIILIYHVLVNAIKIPLLQMMLTDRVKEGFYVMISR